MAQNRSSAVMQQRREPHDSLDYFPTPPWATRALCELLAQDDDLSARAVWEPACGEGHMARPLAEYFAVVHTSDVHDYSARFGAQGAICDFLNDADVPLRLVREAPEYIVTNPPFRVAPAFVLAAMRRASAGVAMLVRTSFLEGGARYRDLFLPCPPSIIAQFCERVPMFKGRLDAKGSTATSYAWIVWYVGDEEPTRFQWIAPCRARLERKSDYPAAPAGPVPLFELDANGEYPAAPGGLVPLVEPDARGEEGAE